MSVRGATSRFVGRDTELAALETAVAEATAGRPAAVLVGGEAGVGKSRLVRELAHEQRGGPARVLVGNCVEVAEGELPYAPVVGALRALSADLEADELDELIGPARPALERLLPDLAGGDGTPLTGDIGQARLFELLLGFLGRAGSSRPLVLVIEDLHWADASTRDLVSFLVRSTTSERLALIGTYRSDDLHRRHPLRPLLAELDRAPRVRRVTLAPFSRAEFADHVASIAGDLPGAQVIEELYERSEGNAFLTEELLAGSSGPGDLPESVRDAMLVRLERLSELAQQVVRVAAAAGRRVDHRLLAAVAGVDETTLFGALREAVAAQVLVPDSSDRSYEFRHALLRETAYEDLLPGEREGLHVALARVLDAQPELAADGTGVAAELAYHWFAAYEFDLALPASVTAGKEATMVAAHTEAQRHFERALELYSRVPAERRGDLDEVELLRLAADAAYLSGSNERPAALVRRALGMVDEEADPSRTAVLTARLGEYLFDSGSTDEALAMAARATALMPDAPTAERAQLLAAEARLFMSKDRWEEAGARAEQAIAIAREVGADAAEASALATLTAAVLETGDYDGAAASAERGRALAMKIGDVAETGRGYVNGSEALDQAGRLEEAIALTLEGIEHMREAGLLRVHGVLLMAEAAARMLKLGRVDEAVALAEDALTLAPTGGRAVFLHQDLALAALHRGDVDAARLHKSIGGLGDMEGSQWLGPATMIDAQLLLAEGDAAAALSTVESTLAAFGAHEYSFYTAPLRALGARAAADLAQSARALRDDGAAAGAVAAGHAMTVRLEEQIASFAPASPAPETLAHRAQLEAELSRAGGESDSALWEDAVQRWDGLGMRPSAAYCAWRQAEALVAAGDRSGAQAAIVRAHADAVATGSRPLVDEIEALVRRGRLQPAGGAEAGTGSEGAAAESEASAADRLGLTPRELEVLGQVAEGRTNRQIGEQLFISEKTASVHVSRILSKVGATNRGEAAAIARRLGLAGA
jgi:DNA-binding CsgD family transcriptional regulator/tetratricopeptide (TPR) repeat protein